MKTVTDTENRKWYFHGYAKKAGLPFGVVQVNLSDDGRAPAKGISMDKTTADRWVNGEIRVKVNVAPDYTLS